MQDTTLWTTIGKPFVVGGGLLAGVYAWFKMVDEVLAPDVKREITRWLRVRNLETGIIADEAVNWPETFAMVFDRVFGEKHLSWKCFFRSCLASYAVVGVVILLTSSPRNPLTVEMIPYIMIYGLLANALPDYVSLLETRYLLGRMSHTQSALIWFVLIVTDLIVTAAIALLVTHIILSFWWVGDDPLSWRWTFSGFYEHFTDFHQANTATIFFFPAFFTSIWLWLYAGSGFLLKAARRFDIGFDWFNRKFDIEKKPLQSIGLVAGALVAVVYWAVVIAARVFG